VEHFKQNQPSYRAGKFNEAQLRLEFLNPFFEALGWDVSNRSGYAEAYKDVVVEPSLEVEGEMKAPDYAFRIGGTRKFFVEAKKPAVNIQYDIYPAFQLRRYAWSAKLPLGILTDFEEFAVYDCRSKPNPTDQAGTGRAMFLKFTDYIEKWDEIAGIFSKDAVMKGSFDQFAQGVKGKHGTQEVDDAFLKEIEGWRELLARNLAIRNTALTVPELNYAVQMTIDRIVFLRICEDRGIEPQEQLKALLEQDDIYSGLCGLFRKADTRYNSGLFHFEKEKTQSSSPDGLCLALAIDDKPLKEIIKSLYFPCPYVFSVIPADILGQVYERFLGKVIRLTAGHQAKVEEKPEVRKAGGVYYTPTYIVEYIVKNTVGKLLEGKTPKEAAELKIVDPACGSGSFLLGAYQHLLDWHTKWYSENDPQAWAKAASPRVYQAQGGEWRLTTAEKKRILLDNIHGVDIDPQAVEVTKLSLSLKVLEGESQESIGTQLGLFKERALPDLGRNIQCGNSLIGPDYYNDRQLELGMEGAEERSRVNAFDWQSAFPQVFARGGFDAVIGNPPYLFITELVESDKKYFFQKYLTTEYRFDVYGLFIEMAICLLLRQKGILSLIIPHTLLNNDSFGKLRRLLLTKTYINEILDIGPGVFENARNETMIILLQKGEVLSSNLTKIVLTNINEFPKPLKQEELHQVIWAKNRNASWSIKVTGEDIQVISKMENFIDHLGEICTINQGLRTGNNLKYLSENQEDTLWKPVVGGKNVGRYEALPNTVFVFYNPKVLDAPRNPEIFESQEKLIVQEIRNITLARRIIATYDDQQFYCLQSTNVINLRQLKKSTWNLYYLLGILNSKAINYFFRQHFLGNNHVASNQLAQLPIPKADKTRNDFIILLVKRMLELHKRIEHTPHEQDQLQREIEATDKQIDALVYELYGLTEEEIKVIEYS
jgi:type I restriction-modification system DNA methylase subunit